MTTITKYQLRDWTLRLRELQEHQDVLFWARNRTETTDPKWHAIDAVMQSNRNGADELYEEIVTAVSK